jgi:hypothetical protein
MAAKTSAHMHISSPPPICSKENKFCPPGDIDYNYDSPLDANGSDFPCKGKLGMLSGPAGTVVASWQGGSQQSFTITGGAYHDGGSCQASISQDKGATWKVVKSYIGNCPTSAGGQFSFTVPNISGDVLFGWTWFNKVGNREMYMNCAAVNIAGSGTDSLSSLPDIFVANIGNGCSTTEGVDLEFPNPGESVERDSQDTGPPVGNCAAVKQGSSTISSGTPAPSPPSYSPANPAPVSDASPGPTTNTSSTPAPDTGSGKFDDGLYHPSTPDNYTTGPTTPTNPASPAESTTGNGSGTRNPSGTGPAVQGATTGPSPAPSGGDVYGVYMDIDGKKMQGIATLHKQVPTGGSQYSRRAVQFRA